jgi:hypothetical protein
VRAPVRIKPTLGSQVATEWLVRLINELLLLLGQDKASRLNSLLCLFSPPVDTIVVEATLEDGIHYL